MWFWLIVAVVGEVFATISLRFAEGFTRLVPSLFVVVGYGVAFFSLSRALVRGCQSGSPTAPGQLWA